MPGLYLEELEVGRTFEHAIRRTVTEMDNMLFSCLTRIRNRSTSTRTSPPRASGVSRCSIQLFTLALMIGISVNDTTVGTTVGNLGMSDVRFPNPRVPGRHVHVTTEVLTSRETSRGPTPASSSSCTSASISAASWWRYAAARP